MKKIMSSILSIVLLLSALSFSVSASAAEQASLLMPTDNVSGVITATNTSDLYYVDLENFTYDFNLQVEVGTEYDMILEFYNKDDASDVFYNDANYYGKEVLTVNAKNLEPGRYYVRVLGEVAQNASSSYNLNCQAAPSNPGVYSGTNLLWGQSAYTNEREAYYQFTVQQGANVNIGFGAPINKEFGYIIYNENEVLDYFYTDEFAYVDLNNLDAGTYYIKVIKPHYGEGRLSINASLR